MKKYAALDVGGTAVKYSLMDEDGTIEEKGEIPTPKNDRDGFIDIVVRVYEKYKDQVSAVVMSAPGRIDSSKGYFYTSGALGYLSGINLCDSLKDKIPVPFAVENDGKAAALAELWKGSMQGVKNGTVIVLGTGIGGAIIIDGHLYRGSTFAAGEYSCIAADFHKPYSMTDLWASHCGVGGLIRIYAGKTDQDPSALNGRILFSRANDGDADAVESVHEYCKSLAVGLLTLQTILDVEKMAIGGGISKQPLLMEALREEVNKMYEPAKDNLPFSLPEIVPCVFGNDANMIGALYHYLYELKAEA